MTTDEVTKKIEHTASLENKRFERWISDVSRGRYPLRTVLNSDLRNRIESKIVESMINGELSEFSIRQLIEDQLIMIKISFKTIDTVPEQLRDVVKEIIDAGVTFDPVSGTISFDKSIVDRWLG